MSKTIYCGECEKFAYEDTDGYGFCLKTNEECRCSYNKGEAIIHYDFQLLKQLTK